MHPHEHRAALPGRVARRRLAASAASPSKLAAHAPAARAAPAPDARAASAPAARAASAARATSTALIVAASALVAHPAAAQDMGGMAAMPEATPAHEMWATELGAGWRLLAMGQLFPVVTFGAPGEEGSPLNETGWYVTQPALMADLQSPDARWVLRATLNFEGVTQEEGELTFGGWGEGFLDKRHPHTLLHELMLSFNAWNVGGGTLSLSAGKGFAPYGTDDPMARPGLKYPTNHHLSQILERWTANGVWLSGNGWSVEAGVFGGAEPEGPYDLGNIESFGDSWSARVSKRWGGGTGPMAVWEASASYGSVSEEHHDETVRTALWNVALRRDGTLGAAHIYHLLEASTSDPDEGDGYFSVLAEMRAELGRHQPWLRLEVASRPEYEREGGPGSEGFFRYDHDAHAIGATRWVIADVGWGYELTGYPWSVRPFVDLKYHRVRGDRGPTTPAALFGTTSFWSVSVGARLFIGGDPMRMGAYGVLDPMTAMDRMTDEGHAGHEMGASTVRDRGR